MSVFKNVSGGDLDLQVDGRRYGVLADESVKIPDEFDAQLLDQPHWEFEDPSLQAAAVEFRAERDAAFEALADPAADVEEEVAPVVTAKSKKSELETPVTSEAVASSEGSL